MWVGVIAGTELIRFSATVCLLLGSGFNLQKYLKIFLVQQQLWDRSGQLFESILKQERATMGGSSSPSSSSVDESKSGVRSKQEPNNDASVRQNTTNNVYLFVYYICTYYVHTTILTAATTDFI
jgi:hypothetical protein